MHLVSGRKMLSEAEVVKAAAVLTTRGRKRIKKKNFSLKGGRYPIHDIAHARNALARVSQYGAPAEKATVRSKVYAKYPGMLSRANS
jgi:hypothetical protein